MGLLALNFELYGALTALSINQSIAFFIILILCYKSDWLSIKYLVDSIDYKTLVQTSNFAVISLPQYFLAI